MSLRLVALVLGALLAAVFAGCAAPPDAKPALPPVTPIMMPPAIAATGGDALEGRTWVWQRTQFSDGKVVTPDAPERYTLEFMPDGRVQVRADCNRGGARYEARADRTLTLSPAATTKMGCPAGSQGTEFVRELATVGAYMIADGGRTLTLRVDGGSMTFAPLAR